MKTRPNPLALLLHLTIAVEMTVGSTFCFPGTALARVPENASPAPALHAGNHTPAAADNFHHGICSKPRLGAFYGSDSYL